MKCLLKTYACKNILYLFDWSFHLLAEGCSPSLHRKSTALMSQTPLLPAPGNFQSIFDTALNQYKKMTKNDLVAHQLTAQLESCTSPSVILAVLDEHYGVQQFVQSQNNSERPKQWLNATANVICAFSATFSGTVGLVRTASSNPSAPNIHFSRFFRQRA